jgi:integrase/recombinase XerD
VICKAR